MAKLTRILSIDGGGIRGIIPAQVLISLEEKLKAKTKNQNARIADYFDLIAGTSTGGILTCIYLCPNIDERNKLPRFTAKEALNLYLDRGDEIFDVSIWKKIQSGMGVLDEKYSADELEESLNDYFSDLKLSQLLKPCLITAYDIKRRKAMFFTQHDAKNNNMFDFFVKDVARATSAAPTYFETVRVKSETKVPYPLIDGGVYANNPTMCAYAEARNKLRGNPMVKDMAILSIGTGYIKKQYNYKTAKDWGYLEWAKPLIDIMMSASAETVDYQMKQIFNTIQDPKQYLRIDSKLMFANPEMDDASEENLIHLEEDGKRIAEEFSKELDEFIKYLI